MQLVSGCYLGGIKKQISGKLLNDVQAKEVWMKELLNQLVVYHGDAEK